VPDEFGDVYKEHVASVWRYVRARVPTDADAEDVTSDVFIRATRSWERYEPSRGSVVAWLVGIARHTVADWWRRSGREVPTADVGNEMVASGSPEDTVVRRDAAARVRSHLGLLTDKERDAVALRFGSGLSAAEVGGALGVSDTAARMLVYRAISKLRGVLEDE
jgi:RNA polymerase sigma factor (sigma-70 family)